MMKSVRSILTLLLICAVMAVLMAVTNTITAPIIEQNQAAAANDALKVVMPNGQGFEKMDVSGYTLPATVTEVYSEASGGYVFKLTTTGYSSGLVILCGVNADGTVSGATCLASTETLGYEKTFGENFIGKNMEGVDGVDTVSGATISNNGYMKAIERCFEAVTILEGGAK